MTIRYELTRIDLLVSWTTVFFRNRLLQWFLIAILMFNVWQTVGPDFATQPISSSLVLAMATIFTISIIMFSVQLILGIASVLLQKHHGVIGEHILEITEDGLVERTEYNDSLHKWPSVVRISKLFGYLFIYVANTQAHMVPIKRLSKDQYREFELALRARAKL